MARGDIVIGGIVFTPADQETLRLLRSEPFSARCRRLAQRLCLSYNGAKKRLDHLRLQTGAASVDELMEWIWEHGEAIDETLPPGVSSTPRVLDEAPGRPMAHAQDEDGTRKDPSITLVWLPVAMNGELRLIPVSLTRREVLAAGGAAILAPLGHLFDLGEQERLGAVISGNSRPDLRVVEHLETLLAEYRKLDDLTGPRHVHGMVQSTLNVIDDWSKSKAAQFPVRQALLSISAQYEQLNGWLWVDRGNYAMAQRSYDRAIARATESGDHPLAGYLLTCKSSAAFKEEGTASAIALAQEAQAGRWGLSPAVRALAAAREARAWALEGESTQCERKLDEAARWLAESTEKSGANEPPWIYWFVAEALPVHRGLCYLALGRSAAIGAFEDAIARLPAAFVRDRGECLAWLAKAHLRNSDPDQATQVALEAAHIAIETGSTSILLGDLRSVSADLEASGNLRAARKLGELLESAV